MRQPPTNKNVPASVWNMAVSEHEDYLRRHRKLMAFGLTEQEADQYLDAMDLVNHKLDYLDPDEEDFKHDDLAPTFQGVLDAITQMRQCWETGCDRYAENWRKANSR